MFNVKKQAEKLSHNPLSSGEKSPRAVANRRLIIVTLILAAMTLGPGGFSAWQAHRAEKKQAKEAAAQLLKEQKAAKKKVIKPLSDEDFEGAKEYNFYTQLEERSLNLRAEDKFGGIMIDNVNKPPQLQLESVVQPTKTDTKVALKPESPKNNQPVKMAPLVLESTQKVSVRQEKPTPQQTAKKTRILQIGSFISQKEAEKQQAKLSQYGFAPRIIQGKNNAQKTVYRVHLGPFSDKELNAIKERLGSLKISYFEVK